MNPPTSDSPKVTFVTAGGAGMFCGSCMRDNTLVRNLARLGWDVELVPAYTPIRTDEADVSVDQVFFGGINMFLQQKVPLARHAPGFLLRWLDHPWIIRQATRGTVKVNAAELGAMTLATLEGEHGVLRREHEKFVQWLRDSSRPGLVNLTNLLIGGCVPLIRRTLPGVPVLVTLQGDDLFLGQLTEPWRQRVVERMRTLAREVDGFVTFSPGYAELMGDLLGIPAEKFHIVPLGIEPERWLTIEPETNRPRAIGYFARMAPEKGFHHAVDAFIEFGRFDDTRNVRFLAGGWLSAQDENFFQEQRRKIVEAGLGDRFAYVGSPDWEGKAQFFRQIDVFSVPADFFEPKGLYALEALAAGIPVIQPAHGSFPPLLSDCPAATLVEPRDPGALAAAWRSLLNQGASPSSRAEARRHVQERATANLMAEKTAQIYERFLSATHPS